MAHIIRHIIIFIQSRAPPTPSQQVEYFYATLVFVMKNPYHHLTWSAWKPQRFYNAVSEHISDIFGR